MSGGNLELPPQGFDGVELVHGATVRVDVSGVPALLAHDAEELQSVAHTHLQPVPGPTMARQRGKTVVVDVAQHVAQDVDGVGVAGAAMTPCASMRRSDADDEAEQLVDLLPARGGVRLGGADEAVEGLLSPLQVVEELLRAAVARPTSPRLSLQEGPLEAVLT